MIELLGFDLLLDPGDAKIYPETAYLPMSSFLWPFIICVILLFFAYVIGPWLTEHYQLIDGEPTETVKANVALCYEIFSILNFLLAAMMTGMMITLKYSLWCQRANPSEESSMAILMWFFLVIKIIECFELVVWLSTLDFNYRVTHFITYHHVTSILLAWLGIKIVPGGTAAVLATVNSWAHFLMYFYFMCKYSSGLNSNTVVMFRNWVVMILVVQFGLSAVISIVATHMNCGFPKSVSTGLVYYMLSLVLGFFIQNSKYLFGGEDSDP